jgi:hypothetical protein
MSQTLQMISTRVSLVSLALGFSIFGMVIIVNQHQADLNGLSGSSSFAMFGGIAAILVGTVFLVAACLGQLGRDMSSPSGHDWQTSSACRLAKAVGVLLPST